MKYSLGCFRRIAQLTGLTGHVYLGAFAVNMVLARKISGANQPADEKLLLGLATPLPSDRSCSNLKISVYYRES